MSKKVKFTVLKDLSDEKDKTYSSESTIDDPPRDEAEPEALPAPAAETGVTLTVAFDENGQAVIPGSDSLPEVVRADTDLLLQFPEMHRDVKFSLKLTLDNCSIDVAKGECCANEVEEALVQSLQTEVFLRMLRASVGRPQNAGLVAGDISVRLMTQKTIADLYQRALEYVLRRIPLNPETFTMAELDSKFEEARKEAKRTTIEAEALRAGVEPRFDAPVVGAVTEPEIVAPKSPESPANERSDDGEGNGSDQGENF